MSYFEDWLKQQGLSGSSIKKYEGAITGSLTQWATDNQIISGSLLDVNNSIEFSSLVKQIEALSIFKERNATGHHMYSSALLKYSQYLNESPSNKIEQDIDSIVKSDIFDITEKAALIKTRIGQGHFRGKLINYWRACSVTQFLDVDLLVASHIKPWAASDNRERTDVYNGLLLLPNLDRAFDLGYIAFGEEGHIVISKALGNPQLAGISQDMRIKLSAEHQIYFAYHRLHVFKDVKHQY